MEIHIPPVKRLHASSDNNTQYVLSLYVQFISCKGEIENLPSDETKAPRPSAKQITPAEVMLELWHHVALIEKGDRKRLKRAVYLKASGMRPRAVQELTGLNYQQLWKAQKDACSDVWEKIMQLSQLRG